MNPSKPVPAFLGSLSAIRLTEVAAQQGTPLLGAFFASRQMPVEQAAPMALLCAGSTCLTAHVFLLNDWSEIGTDIRDPNRTPFVFTEKGIGRTAVGYLCVGLLLLGLALLSRLGPPALGIGTAIALLSALYSFPTIHLKGVPLLSSAVHLAIGLLHFLLGYCLFSPIDRRGLLVGSFFALILAAGHLTHETRDSDGDRLNGIRTNATTFGKRLAFVCGFGMFTAADGLLAGLALTGVVPRLLLAVAALYPLHTYWSAQTLRAGLDYESVRHLQTRYRARYLLVGLLMVLTRV